MATPKQPFLPNIPNMASTPSPSELVPILKGKVSYFSTVAKSKQEDCNAMETYFVKALVSSRNEALLLDYLSSHRVFVHLDDSTTIGIYTKIAPYTDKKGNTKDAHFTQHGNYCGSIKALGTKPTKYAGWFPVSLDKFKVHWNDEAKTIGQLFTPKTN